MSWLRIWFYSLTALTVKNISTPITELFLRLNLFEFGRIFEHNHFVHMLLLILLICVQRMY